MKQHPHICGIAAAVTFFCTVGIAEAQVGSVCGIPYYPIYATGSACYGPTVDVTSRKQINGVTVCCLAQPQPNYRQPDRVHPRSQDVRNQRIAAGLQGAAAMVQILAILIDMVESSSPSPEAEREEIRARERGEQLDARRKAAAWAASGLRQLKAGDETSAAAHFGAATQEATKAKDYDMAKVYQRNMNLALAQQALKLGLEHLGLGEKDKANAMFQYGLYYARLAKSDELAGQIAKYLEANPYVMQTKKRPNNAKSPGSCLEVNGQLMCD
jgi:hypothetical protein